MNNRPGSRSRHPADDPKKGPGEGRYPNANPPDPDGPDVPPSTRATTVATNGFHPGWLALVGLAFLIFVFGEALLNIAVDWQWFGSVGFQNVYSTVLTARLGVFVGSVLLVLLFVGGNWTLAQRITRPSRLYPGQQLPIAPGLVRNAIAVGSVLLALLLGLVAQGQWSTILRYLNQTPFGTRDPILNEDIGFYVFTLPFYEAVRGWLLALVVLTVIGVVAIYLTRPSLFGTLTKFNPDSRVGGHIAALGALFLALIAWGYTLDAYNLLFAEHGPLTGVSYADDHARLLAFRILFVVALGAAALLLVTVFVRRWLLLLAAFAVWILALVVVGGIYPEFVQNFQVRPSELALERPYIQNHIAATRAAFGIDKFSERPYDASESPSQTDLATNDATVKNIRLWDYRPLHDVFTQLQAIRSYYVFNEQNGVDIDRYPLAGGERQVMIAAREMDVTRLPEQANNWLNQHLVYTHGYGVVAVPVNEIQNAGLPALLVKDLPPQSSDPVLAITQPRIYFGEQESEYAFVNTGQREFDYPLGSTGALTDTAGIGSSDSATTVYSGTAGVRLGGFFNKMLFALHFGDGNVMLSEYITDQTRILLHRNFHEAVRLVAPFLRYDRDPYIVIADGKLYWIQDAYTVTDRYPYSQPYDGTYNYIRNSVKIVVDAYNGTMDYYVFDPSDPIIQTYQRIFPTLFKAGAQMPASLRAHIRYPESMFNVQAQMYATYHMTEPTTFYGREDAWKVPFGNSGEQSLPMEAYYNIMRVPGEQREEFLLMVPFTPATRQNMIAWMAAKGDDPAYGRVDVIRFPRSKTFYGPEQINSLINTDPQISQDLTLWGQRGSTVVRGNLLVIPIAQSVIYVQPLFIQGDGGALPRLQRVIAVVGSGVGYGDTLSHALVSAFSKQGNGTPLPPPPLPTPGVGTPQPTPGLPTPVVGTPGVCAGTPSTLAQSALDHYQRSQAALRQGDWATYGQEQAAMEGDLHCLEQITKTTP